MVNLRCEKRKADEVRPHRYSEVQVHDVDEIFMLQKMSRLCLYKENSPGESVRKLKAMFASGTMVSMQLSPLVSIKSWRVMAVGSMWCSRNGRIKACKTHQTPWNTLFGIQQQSYKSADGKSLHSNCTFPKIGRSTEPHVSAPQWTSPDAKSAVSIPATEKYKGWGEDTGWLSSSFLRCYLQILSTMYHKCPKWKLASRWMKLKAMREKQRTTLIHSWHLLPKRDSLR